jgi:cysteinyl-tRNA synthetase
MIIKLTNSLTRKKEEFKPIYEGKVGIYSCGLTVYGAGHVGNYRTFIMSDILRRLFEFNGYEVKHVMNITDVGHLVGDVDDGEDKMIVAMKREGKSAWDVAAFYTDLFTKDMERLNNKTPHVLPKATDHIPEQIETVKILEEKGFTYKTSDGIYFDTSKLDNYGQLGGQKLDEKEEGARVVINPEKRNATDFALWKFSPKAQQRDMEWDSPWGIGFPGWHIECSAMAEKYLDSPFDIHTGGSDLAPVHHENEIAQTQGAHGNGLANVWLHAAFLQIDGGKMSKSLNNVYTIQDLVNKGFNPLAYRYFTFNANYRTQLNFTWEALEAAQNALNNLRDESRDWDEPIEVSENIIESFKEKINDDLDLPGAMAVLWGMVGDKELATGIKSATLLKLDEVLGLNLDVYVAHSIEIPGDVQELLNQRASARQKGDWDASDALRDQIAQAGFVVEDTDSGQRLREKHVLK